MSSDALHSIDDAIQILDLDLASGAREKLEGYLTLLMEANRQFNLTAIKDRDEAASRLIAESLAILPLIPDGARGLIDVGTGGGVPGIPLAIARPDLRVDLLDATRKKVRFLHDVAHQLELDNVVTIHARAEEYAHQQGVRERYDLAVARAVARLPALVELVLPFVRAGGSVILPKGDAVQDEIGDAKQAIRTLGGKLQPLYESPINQTRLVVIEKQRATPPVYPRRPGVPQKQPISVPSR